MGYLLYYLTLNRLNKSKLKFSVTDKHKIVLVSDFDSSTMNRKIILYSFLFICLTYANCERIKDVPKSKKVPILPYFRRKVEELDNTDILGTAAEDPHNFVSFLVKNVKEIFDDIVDTPEEKHKEIDISVKKRPPIIFISNTSTTPFSSLPTVLIKPILDFFTAEDNIMSSSSVSTSTHTTDLMLNENLSITALLDEKRSSTKNNEMSTRHEIMQLEKQLKFNAKADKKERDITAGRTNITDADAEMSDPRRSCIMCNNVETEHCNDPKHKL